jgi:hypothetical protein
MSLHSDFTLYVIMLCGIFCCSHPLWCMQADENQPEKSSVDIVQQNQLDAAQFGNKKIVQLLIDYHADPFIRDNELPAIPARTPRQEAEYCRTWIRKCYRPDLEKIIKMLKIYERRMGSE